MMKSPVLPNLPTSCELTQSRMRARVMGSPSASHARLRTSFAADAVSVGMAALGCIAVSIRTLLEAFDLTFECVDAITDQRLEGGEGRQNDPVGFGPGNALRPIVPLLARAGVHDSVGPGLSCPSLDGRIS